jgi:hypothetical protein
MRKRQNYIIRGIKNYKIPVLNNYLANKLTHLLLNTLSIYRKSKNINDNYTEDITSEKIISHSKKFVFHGIPKAATRTSIFPWSRINR